MFWKISRKRCLHNYPNFPQSDNQKEEFLYPKVYNSYILTTNAISSGDCARKLGRELTSFSELLDINHFIFLGDSTQTWLCQSNSYKPVKEAIHYLIQHKVGLKFNGAIKVERNDLYEFIMHLFWLIRCNAAMADIYFMNEEQDVLLLICKHGNVHIDILNKKKDKQLLKILSQLDLTFIEDKICYESFSDSGAIKGRATIV